MLPHTSGDAILVEWWKLVLQVSLFFYQNLLELTFLTTWASFRIACLIYQAIMDSKMSVYTSMTLIFKCIPGIFLSFPSLWLDIDSQSAMYNCIPGIYRNLKLYWWMHSSILCRLCDRAATSFLGIATNPLCSSIILTLQANQQWRNFSNVCSIPSESVHWSNFCWQLQ